MTALRIGVDVRCLSDGKHTGVEEYTRQLLEHLLTVDQTNEYLLFCNSWQPPRTDFSWLEKFPHARLRMFRLPNKLLNLSLWYLRWPKIDRLLGGVDIFFMPNLNFIAVSRDAKLVLTVHDLSFDVYPETFGWKQRLWHALVGFRSLIRRADAVVAVSQTTRAECLARYGRHQGKIVVVHNGIDARFRLQDRNDPDLIRVKERYRLPFRFILYFGTLEPRKNIEAIIRAYEYGVARRESVFMKHSLVIAGSCGWRYRSILRAIRNSPVRERIILTGFVADSDRPALYALATLFVYPSVYEGFGFPPLEAMASGVPVITSNASVFPEIVGTAGILTDPQNPEELYQAMREVLGDRALQETLRIRGLERARQFSWSKAALRMRGLWKKV